MTEGLFVLTTLFVAYVIYVIINEKKSGGDKTTKPVAAVKQEPQQATVTEKPKAVTPPPKAAAATPKPKPAAVAKKAPAVAVAVKAEPAPAKPAAVKPTPAPTPAKPTAAKTSTAKKAPAAPAVAKAATPAKPAATKAVAAPVAETSTLKGTGLKDPSTGEVATAYSNYRFTKRWIKEALVAEKLLDKVYKNDELNASIEAKIKVGMIKLEAMAKYKP